MLTVLYTSNRVTAVLHYCAEETKKYTAQKKRSK